MGKARVACALKIGQLKLYQATAGFYSIFYNSELCVASGIIKGIVDDVARDRRSCNHFHFEDWRSCRDRLEITNKLLPRTEVPSRALGRMRVPLPYSHRRSAISCGTR
jgi:hypothetical protein